MQSFMINIKFVLWVNLPHRPYGDIKETTIQSLKGAMREGDYGVFVTLSDYTKNAKKYLVSLQVFTEFF